MRGSPPGRMSFVNTAFDDTEAIQKKHPKEVDDIITDVYNELKEVIEQSAKFDTITEAWDAIQVSSHVKSERSTLQRAGFLPSTHRHPFGPLPTTPSTPSTDQLHTDSV